jgi:hypothetical protein
MKSLWDVQFVLMWQRPEKRDLLQGATATTGVRVVVRVEEIISVVAGAIETIAESPMTDVMTAEVTIAEILTIDATTAEIPTTDVMIAEIPMIEETLEKRPVAPN